MTRAGLRATTVLPRQWLSLTTVDAKRGSIEYGGGMAAGRTSATVYVTEEKRIVTKRKFDNWRNRNSTNLESQKKHVDL